MESRSRSTEPFRPPRVTVLMAVYNGMTYLRQAVESILTQTFRDFEFLVINDGSTDDSRAIIASYDDSRIRILDNPENIGLTRSLNRGLAAARGELIARQDADDVSHPCRLEKQVLFLDSRPSVVLVGSQARFINEWGQPSISRLWWKANTPAGIRFQLLFDSPFFHTSTIFRRKVIWGVLRGYDETFKTSQDFELWSRVLKIYEAANLSEILVDQRSHPNSVSSNYSSVNAHRVERVFEENLNTVLGVGHSYKHWPALWVGVTNPKLQEPCSPPQIFGSIRSIYQAFPKRELTSDALVEIKLQYASKLLLAAQLLGRQNRFSSMINILRAFAICPPLIAGELPRTVASMFFGRLFIRPSRTSSVLSIATGDRKNRKQC